MLSGVTLICTWRIIGALRTEMGGGGLPPTRSSPHFHVGCWHRFVPLDAAMPPPPRNCLTHSTGSPDRPQLYKTHLILSFSMASTDSPGLVDASQHRTVDSDVWQLSEGHRLIEHPGMIHMGGLLAVEHGTLHSNCPLHRIGVGGQ